MTTPSLNPKARLGILGHCDSLGVSIWSCPRFIFLIMGIVIIFSILTTHQIAQRNADPEVVIMIVTLLTIFLLIITQILVNAFEKVVESRQREIARTKEILELNDQFVYLAVHDLAAAATAVKWGLKMVERNVNTILSQDEQEVFTSMRTRNEQLITLVHQILSITRIERGNIILEPTTIILSELIEELVQTHWKKGGANNPAYSIEFAEHLPSLISDREQLKEIIGILLTNARKYSREEQGEVKLRTMVEGDTIILSIENNGKGIAPELQKHIFQKFWREVGSTRIERASFSLYIAQALAHLLGGNISFTSDNAQTKFTFRLPVAPTSPRGSK